MTIENRRQWENTGCKLKELEELYERKRQEPGGDHVRDLTLQSLKRRINRFKEEMARFEAKAGSVAQDDR
jgi:hypothetical protein